MLGGGLTLLEQTRHEIQSAVRRAVKNTTARDERGVRIARDERVDRREMVGRPDVVVADVRDPGPAGVTLSLVVGTALTAAIDGEVSPRGALGTETADDVPGIVVAAVADDNQLE